MARWRILQGEPQTVLKTSLDSNENVFGFLLAKSVDNRQSFVNIRISFSFDLPLRIHYRCVSH